MKKKFVDTKFGSIINKTVPKVLDFIGDADIPGVSQIAKIIDFVVPDAKVKEELNVHLQDYATNELPQLLMDMQDARKREIAIATSEHAPTFTKIITPLLALIVVGLTFLMWYLVLYKEFGAEKDVVVFILGSLSTMCSGVINYYFGSSQGSKDKSETIKKMMQ